MTSPSSDTPPVAPVPLESLAYHRLSLARQRPAWWRGLVTGVLAIVLYAVLLILLIVPFVVLAVFDPQVAAAVEDAMLTTAYFDLDRPWLLAVLTVPLILMIPALVIASRIIEGRGVGLLSSVVGRLRWGWLSHTLLLALAVFAGYFILLFGFGALTGQEVQARVDHPGIGMMLVLVLVLIPFQAAAEEYVFRGYLMQLIGRWLRHPLFPILLPVPLFVFGHMYDLWGMLNVAVFGIVAAWLAWRTGGLEASIAVHTVNNVSIFMLASFALVDANATSGTPVDALLISVCLAVYALLVDRSARARGITRTLEPWTPPAPLPPDAQAAASSSASRIV